MKKQILSVVMMGALLSSTLSAHAAFMDVTPEMQTQLEWLIAKGVVSSDSENFRPDDIVNRAESLKLILASSQVDIDVPNVATTFKDVDGASWYAPYVNSGIELGIVRGYEDGTLRPEQTVNKGEFITMLYRMHQKLRGNMDRGMQFSDVQSSDWYADAASWSALFLNGVTFDASKELTRAETAEIIYAYMMEMNIESTVAFGLISIDGEGMGAGGGKGSMPHMQAEDSEAIANMNGNYSMSGDTMEPDMPKDMILPYPYYHYETTVEYVGPKLADFPEEIEVIKAIPKAQTAVSIPGIFEDLGTIAKVFASMENIHLGYMSFTPAVKDGFMYGVDKMYGSFNINKDWRMDQRDTYMGSSLTEEPADAQLINMANRFLMEKGISTEGYAAPEVDKSWKMYTTDEDYGSYIPDYYTVNYPKMIGDTMLYGVGGYYDQSLSVSIDYSNKTVTGVSGYLPKLEVSSQYVGRSWDSIVMDIQDGGAFAPRTMEIPEDVEEVVTTKTHITYTSAKKVMLAVYNYNNIDENGSPELLYVPGILFSGTSETTYPEGGTYTDNNMKTVVPAVDPDQLSMNMYW